MDDAAQPTIASRTLAYENRFYQVYRVLAQFPEHTKEYFVIESGVRAGLVVARGGSILLVRQYRLLINRLSWEIPGGTMDEGETPQAAAVRECLEETGIRALDPRPLLQFHLGIDTLHCPTFLFHASACEEVPDAPRIAREIDHHVWLPLERAVDMIRDGRIVDSFTIIALLAYQTYGLRREAVPAPR